jgi:16S rRNA (adenine1518-N6/adenine1519-N6)-dimethyltransferase
MVAAIAPRPGQHLVEIGPGFGALTVPLMDRVTSFDVIELDTALAANLVARYPQSEQLRVHRADALSFDFSQLGHGVTRLRLVGNLPYNISTPLLFHLLDQSTRIQDMHFMLQHEVVQRIVASPGHRRYGRLTVMVQFSCLAEQLFTVPASAFRPKPRVTSAVLRLVVREQPPTRVESHRLFARVVREAFAQRRKTLRNSLRGLVSETQFVQAKVDPSARAETLTVQQFATLSNVVHATQSPVTE